MSENKISGIIYKVFPQETGMGQKGKWIKQSFLIETTDQYPKKVLFSVFGDKAEAAGKLIPGSEATVFFNPESREYNNRWYTELKAWKWEINKEYKNPSNNSVTVEDVKKTLDLTEEDQDLPF